MKAVVISILCTLFVARSWFPADGVLTVYWLSSAGHAAARETFAVEPQSRTVSAIVRSSDEKAHFIEPMKDCTIVNARNWQCTSEGIQAVGGVVTVPVHSPTEPLQAVNPLRWWAVRVWERVTNDNYGHQLLPSFLPQNWTSVTLGYALILAVLYYALTQFRELIRRLRAPKAAIPEKRDVRAGWRRAQRA
jgi:hypothetical protein